MIIWTIDHSVSVIKDWLLATSTVTFLLDIALHTYNMDLQISRMLVERDDTNLTM